MYQCNTDRILSLVPSLRNTMSLKVDIGSLTVSKLKSDVPFEKYNIDVAIDEVENNETGIKLKYKFALLSTPTNSKISVEGITSIQGDESTVNKYIEPDEKNIPMAVNLIYQELFPLFYVVTKNVGIPCPAYKISQISATVPTHSKTPSQTSAESQNVAQETPQNVAQETPQNVAQEQPTEQIQEKPEEQSETLQELEQLVEERNVSPN